MSIAGEGIAEGMPVVTRGNERIFPGSPVRTGDGPPGGEAPPEQAGGEGQDEESTATEGDEGR